jgi:hypothetical protein
LLDGMFYAVENDSRNDSRARLGASLAARVSRGFGHRLEEEREVKRLGGEVLALDLEAGLVQSADNVGLGVQVRARRLARARKERPKLLQHAILERLRRERDVQTVLGQARQMLDLDGVFSRGRFQGGRILGSVPASTTIVPTTKASASSGASAITPSFCRRSVVHFEFRACPLFWRGGSTMPLILSVG